MKKILLLTNLLVLFCFALVSYAYESKYAVHTSAKDIEFKKKKALKWHSDNVDNQKFYYYDANKHINSLKNKSLNWYEDKITKGKFYFVNSEKELAFTKKKALRWHENNSK